MKMETARQSYIKLMEEAEQFTDEQPVNKRLSILRADLIAAGYFKGVPAHDTEGIPYMNKIQGLTVQGRLFLQELKEKEREQTGLGRLKKYGLPIVAYFLGVASPVLADALKVLFHLKR